MSQSINFSEWLAELEKCTEAPDGAMSTKQIGDQLGISVERVRRLLHAAQDDGRLAVHRVPRKTLDGYVRPQTVYRITPAKRKK